MTDDAAAADEAADEAADVAAAFGPDRGRLVMVTGTPEPARTRLAGELARRFEHGVLVDGMTFDAMVVSGRASSAGPPGLDELRLRMLRFSAAIATAETFQLDGFDVVLTDDVLGGRLEEFLDLAAPEPVHVVVLDDGTGEPTPHWGLWLGGVSADSPMAETVDLVLSKLTAALVRTDAETE